MGAKTGRGTGFDTEFKYVIKNTLDPQKEELRKALHSLAGLHPQNISYTSMVVTKLHARQEVGPHRDVKNDDSVPNHTIINLDPHQAGTGFLAICMSICCDVSQRPSLEYPGDEQSCLWRSCCV
eukprot:53500-Amphidinium_carterae.1